MKPADSGMSRLVERARKVAGLPERLLRTILYRYFRFDKWHTTSSWDRRYPAQIIKYLNNRPQPLRNSAVEIGCGLGDIIRHLNFERRLGLDQELNALRAAKFLSRFYLNGKVEFAQFNFPESSLEGSYDSIVMVNWIHHIPGAILRDNLRKYHDKNLKTDGEIIIDTVQSQDYKINHSISFLTEGLNCDVIKLGEDVRQREVFAIKKK